MLRRFSFYKYLAKRLTRKYGVMDPFDLLARLRKFSQPSEVQEPLELLREGIKFHARGLINTKVIQNNLDWVWPHWVERQFNPRDIAFIPRAFSFSHINLTHRNWTAVGLPDLSLYPIVDPRGLVTPLHNGWSLDFWVFDKNGRKLFPSRMEDVTQTLTLRDALQVDTVFRLDGIHLAQRARMRSASNDPVLEIEIEVLAESGGRLHCVIRPYNPEGVQFIENIAYAAAEKQIRVNRGDSVFLSEHPDHMAFSDYQTGDVVHRLDRSGNGAAVHCDAGMATAAFSFDLEAGASKKLTCTVPLAEKTSVSSMHRDNGDGQAWSEAMAGSARLEVPDERMTTLFDAAKNTLMLLSTETDIVPGPFTYRRFWFRDACLMLNALMSIGLFDRCRSILNGFPARQKRSGYFHSQAGEWDSNGQVLWILNRFARLSGETFGGDMMDAVLRGGRWIEKKRLKARGTLHEGLLPAGFSAEHLGPNDYYYWDDFWSIAGLRGAAELIERAGAENGFTPEIQSELIGSAVDMKLSVFKSISSIPLDRGLRALPASPYRRMDAGAIGSLVADYPLQIFRPQEPRTRRTVEFLLKHCFVDQAFFQDMIHSGVNAYLTLAVAQTLLRMGDARYQTLIESVGALASSTGQWPEAIHPATGGGCMGDGQHGWAAAEWVMMMRNLFVREENDLLIIGSGVFPSWLDADVPLYFGPAPTLYGTIGVRLQKKKDGVAVDFDLEKKPGVRGEIRVPGYNRLLIQDWTDTHMLRKNRQAGAKLQARK